MTDPAPIIITSLTELPAQIVRGIVAPTFADAIAEYERKYGAAVRCWQYGRYFYFEGEE